jgi:hypothetical protein
MQVRILRPSRWQHAGHELSLTPGDVLDVSPVVARGWVGTGVAAVVDGAPERAVLPGAPERAVGRAGRRRAVA